jgi:hypothetical protein
LTRKPGFKTTEHGGQKIAEALFNELTSLGGTETPARDLLSSGRKKDAQQFKKNKQQRSTTTPPLPPAVSSINECLAGRSRCSSVLLDERLTVHRSSRFDEFHQCSFILFLVEQIRFEFVIDGLQ